MKRFLLSVFITVVSVFASNAEISTVDYTYSDATWSSFGKSQKETVNVAMRIDNPRLLGMKITGIRAYVSTTELSGTSVWLSKDLTIENKVNVPDIASFDVIPEAVSVGPYDVAELAIKLDEPYVFTGEPLFVGYTITVDDFSTYEQRNPVVISKNIDSDGLWVQMSKSVLKWTPYSERAKGVAVIVAEIEGDFPSYSMTPVSVDDIFVSNDESIVATVNVLNMGANSVNKLSYSCSLQGGGTQYGEVDFVAPIEPNLVYTYPVEIRLDAIDTEGVHNMNLTLETLNEEINGHTDPSIDFKANVASTFPVHRPLLEEYTGLWCSWCTKGYLTMEELIPEAYDDTQLVGVVWHNGDPMAITDSYPIEVYGYPGASIDRGEFLDPYYGSTGVEDFGISKDINLAIAKRTIADIEVEASMKNGIVSLNSTATFIGDIDSHDYEIGYVVTANGLHNESWGQGNAYASQGDKYAGTFLEVLTTWPSMVFDLVFNSVVITADGMNGIENSLPEHISMGVPYRHEYNYDLKNIALASMTDDFDANVFIVDKKTGRVINANKSKVINESGVETVNRSEVTSVYYLDLLGREVNEPANGIFIMVKKMSDGTVNTSKVMIK